MTWFFYLEENKKGSRPPEFAYAGPDDPSPPSEGSRGGGGGNQDPEAMFAERDKDSDGKLVGDEISERMQARLEEVDTDKDSAVSKEEFITAWKNRKLLNLRPVANVRSVPVLVVPLPLLNKQLRRRRMNRRAGC